MACARGGSRSGATNMCDLFGIEGKAFKKTFCARMAALCLEIVRFGCCRNVKFPHTSVCILRVALEHVFSMLENLKCSLYQYELFFSSSVVVALSKRIHLAWSARLEHEKSFVQKSFGVVRSKKALKGLSVSRSVGWCHNESVLNALTST